MVRSFARLLFLLLVALGPASADDTIPERLRIGLLPGESAPTVLRLNEPMREYLEKRLGLPVDLVVGTTYSATGEALRFGRIDIAYLGPVTYVLQSQRAPLVPFARPSHHEVGPVFEAAIIVPADSAVQSLKDLAGAEIVFGDPASTSSTWVPQYELLQAGLSAEKDYTPHFLGSHDAVALAIANGKAAAGGISLPVYERLLSQGAINPSKVRLLISSRPIPEYAFTFRAGLDPAFQDDVAAAFRDTEDPAVLKVFRAERFVPAVDADFMEVRGWIDALKAAAANP
ncbi:phosphate/phosphite/phosphonate ABC transporter substrate-binding protein [Pseudaminobacter salicylatoxidans]|uniref:phosphate/phosphite/phosphonate ABC transporter substrate-binding protein n=1 Tax=Pseudaminobacter salicylatoxidans TaxID=93369 RepID=UPI0002F06562|nr:phosphate/phosphite/phosphonate ABC transporter substrate-binding protein [Pseudaminobacter salicylatoxidans]